MSKQRPGGQGKNPSGTEKGAKHTHKRPGRRGGSNGLQNKEAHKTPQREHGGIEQGSAQKPRKGGEGGGSNGKKSHGSGKTKEKTTPNRERNEKITQNKNRNMGGRK